MRPPVLALTVAAAVLSQSACLVTVFVKDAGSEETGGTGGSSSTTDPEMSEGTSSTTTTTTSAGDGSTGASTGPAATTLPAFDLGAPPVDGEACSPTVTACDVGDTAIDHALGLNCAGGIVTAGPLLWSGSDFSRMTVSEALGTTDVFVPVEGVRRVLLSTGIAAHALLTLEQLPSEAGCPKTQTCPSTDFPGEDLAALPPPIDPTPQKCKAGDVPPGPGDCSETVLEQWTLGGEPPIAYDYTELRFKAVVPNLTAALRFHFAFLTAEYPARYPGGFNDLFVAWVASERYTGNIALDPDGRPIAAETLPYTIKLDPMPADCEPDCPDLPLRGFAFEGHAGTPWWPAEVAVDAGDTIEVVFALFDVGDAAVDSAVLLDGARWVCSPPTTND